MPGKEMGGGSVCGGASGGGGVGERRGGHPRHK